jgi:NAD(P)-dependent dehydrogenase (short-subunit alcohol dehydrogenase family)
MSERVILITGAHGALGRVVVEAAMKRGLSVATIDHGTAGDEPDGVFAQGGVDLTDAGAAATAITRAAERHGRLDALLNIAGGFVWQTTDAAEPAWDRMFALNLKTALNASRAALPWLKRSDEGRIVNVGANGAVKAAAGMGAYAASKAGVHRLTEALAEEL